MELAGIRKHVFICNGSSCLKKGGHEVARAIRSAIRKHGFSESIHTTLTRCNGRCEDGCTVIAYPDGFWYKNVTPERGEELILHLKRGEPLHSNLAYTYNGKQFVAVESGVLRETAVAAETDDAPMKDHKRE
ncbi:(2Fe-2S) ferredoxin domain-containing protein [Desmospora profundinema]|uniref:(2Fe-2S) ferredoxin n=1 Tax=Desmospora profundinema TaxID=1571184 RepID=A0ABU1IM25_9BACL|nr:(2Fe-2S) ferredoxin domain-containing protein [Desmospora profundinema]MDR6224830.1 (2Fe-2S) ferredoxin [Desmospora profundinema]